MIRGVTGSMTVPRLYNPLTALYLGLLSWYDLEDLTDAVGGRTLTNTNSTTFTSGKVDNAATFVAGSGQSVGYNSSILPGGANAFTIAGWVKSDDSTRWRMIYVGDGTFLMRDYLGISWYVYDSSYRPITLGAPSDGTWMFTALRYDPTIGTYGEFKFNLQYGATSTSGTYSAVATPQSLVRCVFGWPNDGDARGQVDSVGLWSRCLTDDEVSLLWNSGNGVSYAQISA